MGHYVQPNVDMLNYVSQPEELNARYMEWVEKVLDDLTMTSRNVNDDYPSFKHFQRHFIDNPKYQPDFWDEYLTTEARQRMLKRAYKLYDYLKGAKLSLDDKHNIIVKHADHIVQDDWARKMGLHYIGYGRFADTKNHVKLLKKNNKLITFKAKS